MYILNVYFERDKPNEIDDDFSWEELMAAVDEDAAVFWDRDMAHVDLQHAWDLHLQVSHDKNGVFTGPMTAGPEMSWKGEYGQSHARWVDLPWFRGWVPIHLAGHGLLFNEWKITAEWFMLRSWLWR